MPQYNSILTGIHPLSESLIKKIFDFKYGRIASSDHIKQGFEEDIEGLVTLLSQTFAIASSTGNLGWWDLFRPFSEELQGLTHRGNIGNLPVARNPLTNTFYRQPIVEGKVSHDGPILKVAKHPFLPGSILQTRFLPPHLKKTGWTLCLPGPFSFSRAVTISLEGQGMYKSRDELMIDFTKILIEELRFLASEGFSHVICDESAITWEPTDADTVSLTRDLWGKLIKGAPLRLALHTFQHLSDKKLQLLLDSKAWALGIDCIKNDPHQLSDYDFDGKTLIAGVVDAQNYLRDVNNELLVEDIAELFKLANDLAKTQTKAIILAPTSRLEFVPRSVADLKMRTLGKVIEKLQNN